MTSDRSGARVRHMSFVAASLATTFLLAGCGGGSAADDEASLQADDAEGRALALAAKATPVDLFK